MNQSDRKRIGELKAKLEQMTSDIEEIGNDLRGLADAEQEKFDNMPENLRQGEKGEAMETAASALTEAADALENGNVTEAKEALDGMEL